MIEFTLLDKVNLGHMVQGKQRVVSYKVHDKVRVPEDEWYVVENVHEPTFTQDEYDALACVLQRDTRTPNGKRQVHLFSGFLRCYDCNKALQRATGKGRTYYCCCCTYREKSKTRCTKHSIRLDVLESIVLATIQTRIALLESVADIAEDINCVPATELQSKRVEKSLRNKQRALEKARLLATGLYADWKAGEISHDDYRFMKSKFDSDVAQIQSAIYGLEEEQRRLNQEMSSESSVFVEFLKHKNVQQLDRILLVEFVDTIYVHEDKTITIVYRFQDELERIIAFVDAQQNLAEVS